jgi:hypothetical protein
MYGVSLFSINDYNKIEYNKNGIWIYVIGSRDANMYGFELMKNGIIKYKIVGGFMLFEMYLNI